MAARSKDRLRPAWAIVTLLPAVVVLIATPRSLAADEASPEKRAVAYLAAEVPKWQRENKCFSCHNNGDAAQALMLADNRGLLTDRTPLADTIEFLAKPDKWDADGPDGPFKDKNLARIQFAAALSQADACGLIRDRILALQGPYRAAALLAEIQNPDGSWPSDAPGTIGSPVTYGQPLATAIALRALRVSRTLKGYEAVDRGEDWFYKFEPKSVLDAAATTLALHSRRTPKAIQRCNESLAIIEKGQSEDGGWGPFITSPPEVFDTAIVMIALALWPDEHKSQIAAGRKYLLAQQLPDGSWPATTRPPGADSYAQKLSTTGWALQALFVSK
jgi:hypothetical protein